MGGARLFLLGGGGQGAGHGGQILAMKGHLMNAWTITGGRPAEGGQDQGTGGQLPPAKTAHGSATKLTNMIQNYRPNDQTNITNARNIRSHTLNLNKKVDQFHSQNILTKRYLI